MYPTKIFENWDIILSYKESLKTLISDFGEDKVNSLTKYPSIATYHKLQPDGYTLFNEINVHFGSMGAYASEKLNGTNTRLIFYKDSYVIGSREQLLYINSDLFYRNDETIVENVKSIADKILVQRIDNGLNHKDNIVIVYGELFGGKIGNYAKNYGKSVEFRVFDVVEIDNVKKKLKQPIENISHKREHEKDGQIIYGHDFLNMKKLQDFCNYFDLHSVPTISFYRPDDIAKCLESMKKVLPKTNCALDATAQLKPEGIVVRNFEGDIRAKLRFENYYKTLR